MRVADEIAKTDAGQWNPGVEGIWEVIDYQLPFPAAHAALLPTGKVLLLPGGRKQSRPVKAPKACLWDRNGVSLRTWNLPADFSLGALCSIPDGRLLVAGGGEERSAIRIKETYLFDPATEEFLRVNDMPARGPCPTLIELGDGSVLAIGGAGRSPIHAYEMTNGWTVTSHAELDWPLYPQLTLLAEGSILYSGQHFGGPGLVNPGILHSSGRFVGLPEAAVPQDFCFAFREQGSTVLLPPAQDQRVMIIGGGSPPKPDVHILNFSNFEPVLGSAEPLHLGRSNFNTVVLPDHTILVCGGVRSDQGGRSAALGAELYDPSTGVWTSAASAEVPRQEHSSAILLPDGCVMTAGSTDASIGELRVELYHPPYLFRGERPLLEEAPSRVNYGERFLIKTADSDIRLLSLVKPMAASHGFDSGQRLVDVPFESRGSGLLEAIAPENPNVAPPGQYLLFVINHKGTPSHGRWLQLTDPSRTNRPSADFDDEPRSDAKRAGERIGRHTWQGPIVHPIPEVMEPDESPAEPAREGRLPWLDEPLNTGWLDEPASPAWEDEKAHEFVYDRQMLGISTSREIASGSTGSLYMWARPGLIIGSAGLLALSMVLEAAPLRAAAAFLFLLFAPGMALVGLFRPSGWASEAALAIGVSVALETLLTIAGLYFRIWSADGILLALMGVSLSGATVQLIRAAFGRDQALEDWDGFGEVPA